MTRFWSIAAVALLLTALPLGAADSSKMLADASAKASMLAFVQYTIDNDPPQAAGGQALCIDAGQGIFMTYSVEGWMKTKSLKDVSLVLSDGKKVAAELLWVDPEVGLGFFQAKEKGNFTAANFNKTAVPAVGAQVASVGLLENNDHTPYVASAYVSAVIKGAENPVVLVTGHLTSEGSPVFNEAGEVVGVVVPQQFERYSIPNQQGGQQEVMLKNRQNSSVFVPAANIAAVLDYVAKNPTKPRAMAWIGALAMSIPAEALEKKIGKPSIGLPKIVPGQNGEKAGLKDDDVIVAINGKAIEKTKPEGLAIQKFQREMMAAGLGTEITLTVRHKGEKDEYGPEAPVKVRLEAIPTQPQEAARYVSQPLGFVVRDIVLMDQYSRETPAVVKGARGILVMMVGKNTSAYDAGLEPGDVITALGENNTKVEDVAGFKKTVEESIKANPDKEIKLTIRRGTDDMTQTIIVKPAVQRPTSAPANK